MVGGACNRISMRSALGILIIPLWDIGTLILRQRGMALFSPGNRTKFGGSACLPFS